MLSISLFSLFLLAPNIVAAEAPGCAGANPAIVSVSVKSMTSDNGVNRYHLGGTVVNRGRRRQPSNLLQSIDIYMNDVKLDTKGIPPLKPAQSYAFTYDLQRSADAGDATSTLVFALNLHRSPVPRGCDGNKRFTLTV